MQKKLCKLSTHHDQWAVITCLSAISCSNHCLYDFFNLSHCCELILAHSFTTLLQFIVDCGHPLKVFPQHFNQVEGLNFVWITAVT